MKTLKMIVFILICVSYFGNFCYALDEVGNKTTNNTENKAANYTANKTANKIAPKLLAISGSARIDSCNTKALKLLVNAAKESGAKVSFVNIADYPLPIYDADFETDKGLPENVKKLQALIAAHDGLLIASPEYNGLPTPLLKNTFDWSSRTDKNNPNSGLKIFNGKSVALVSASPSPWGGVRALGMTAQLMSNLGTVVIPERVSIGNCTNSFDAKGNLKDEQLRSLIDAEAKAIVALTERLQR